MRDAFARPRQGSRREGSLGKHGGEFDMPGSFNRSAAAGGHPSPPPLGALDAWRILGASALQWLPAVVLLSSAAVAVAVEEPSKPFLEKNSFYLSSAGFRIQVANDP